MNQSHCDRHNRLELYLAHQLSDDEATAVEEHLLYCETCRKELVRMEKVIDVIRSAAEAEGGRRSPEGRPGSTRAREWLRTAALLGLVLLELYIVDAPLRKKTPPSYPINPAIEPLLNDPLRAPSPDVLNIERVFTQRDPQGRLTLTVQGRIFTTMGGVELKFYAHRNEDFINERPLARRILELREQQNGTFFQCKMPLPRPAGWIYAVLERENEILAVTKVLPGRSNPHKE